MRSYETGEVGQQSNTNKQKEDPESKRNDGWTECAEIWKDLSNGMGGKYPESTLCDYWRSVTVVGKDSYSYTKNMKNKERQ